MDALDYALELSNSLEGLLCFLDQVETNPDEEIPESIIAQIRRSRIFVLLASPAAATSQAIDAEIAEFLTTGRVLVPIDLGGAGNEAIWHQRLVGLPWAVEHSTAPSPNVIDRIRATVAYGSNNRRLRTTATCFGVGISALLIGGAAAGGFVSSQLRERIVSLKEEVNTLSAAATDTRGEIENANLLRRMTFRGMPKRYTSEQLRTLENVISMNEELHQRVEAEVRFEVRSPLELWYVDVALHRNSAEHAWAIGDLDLAIERTRRWLESAEQVWEAQNVPSLGDDPNRVNNTVSTLPELMRAQATLGAIYEYAGIKLIEHESEFELFDPK